MSEREEMSTTDQEADKGTCRKFLGLCLGASTITAVHLRKKEHDGCGLKNRYESAKVLKYSRHPHGGNPKRTLLEMFRDFSISEYEGIAVTGRKLHRMVNLSSISEPEAVEYAYPFAKPPGIDCPAVVSAGGETFIVYVLNRNGRISNVITGNKCASGTGEFFLQQLRRMNVSLEEIAQWTDNERPHHVSGRCSVFCKSDCTHATNKGIPKSRVTAGLCVMMANKILELLKKIDRKNIMITGGTAHNQMMIQNLRKEIPDLVIPGEAPYFEALGAALWAAENQTLPFPGVDNLLKTDIEPFEALPPLLDFQDQVTFKEMEMADVQAGDVCILGLDVGSTTTKAVLVRLADHALLASVYLRTNGDPVGASRQCYQAIVNQVEETVDLDSIRIIGLGVCGSGRQIAGLHAMTDGVINEIIAHAAAAVYFDPEVDTIFEIGGQDAKYTYITNGVSSDYAMNEACSAGTGSFLEESALESLNVAMEKIADIALKAQRPPNFNDQCAAFISSDIKNAIHEGVEHKDIIAGLVYSICMNYTNRVKGNRPVGQKVFMQGGVCYNNAVPLAMAALVGKPIIVPPEPGLMGAFGVALEVEKRIESGLLSSGKFDLRNLAEREVIYGKEFICGGGKEKCDRRCKISMVELEGKRFPFGGACNRYYNLRHDIQYDVAALELVRRRQQLVFEKYAASGEPATNRNPRGRVGINRSFLVNTYYPLYSTFFAELGFEPVLTDVVSQKGIDMRDAAFCFPAELAHGFFYSLITEKTPLDYLFLPHFKSVPSSDGNLSAQVCPFVQGEPFYLQSTFKEMLSEWERKGLNVLSPLLDFSQGLSSASNSFISIAEQMGIGTREAGAAFQKAVVQQMECLLEMREIGRQVLNELENDPDRTAVVIFSRPYNGFAGEANMGIPHKLASRGVMVIPFDFLPFDMETSKRHMYWGMGQQILKAARFVERHPQLFGTYITNFSCGPDSFVIGYFRDIMGRKPSLTLELDSHTADAGLETRIEAFLDIVHAYRSLGIDKQRTEGDSVFVSAETVSSDRGPAVRTSDGKLVSMRNPQVTVLFPSMGKLASEFLAAVFRSIGFNAKAHPPSDEAVLKLGRANTSCKECLPLILTTGTLLNYIYNEKKEDEYVVYFMPTGAGPCRFGQYHVFMEDLLKRLAIPDVSLLSLTSENGYAGLGSNVQIRAWWAIVISDVMEDIRSMLLASTVDNKHAMETFDKEWRSILDAIVTGDFRKIEQRLHHAARMLKRISLEKDPHSVPTVFLAGEIFVRRDGISRQYLTEKLAEKGFAVTCASIAEWISYSDYLVDQGLTEEKLSLTKKLALRIKTRLMAHYEKRIKSALLKSGLMHGGLTRLREIISNAEPYISPNLAGEAVLTVGSSLTEVADKACGVIAIGPFGCMPNRMSEAILSETMNRENRLAIEPKNVKLRRVLDNMDELPFLAIESDGSPFPQLIHAKLETFLLRAERLHQRMMGD